MVSGAVIYTKFHKDWFRRSKVNKGGYTDTHTQGKQRNLISLLNFSK
jgi:hypothetical protein